MLIIDTEKQIDLFFEQIESLFKQLESGLLSSNIFMEQLVVCLKSTTIDKEQHRRDLYNYLLKMYASSKMIDLELSHYSLLSLVQKTDDLFTDFVIALLQVLMNSDSYSQLNLDHLLSTILPRLSLSNEHKQTITDSLCAHSKTLMSQFKSSGEYYPCFLVYLTSILDASQLSQVTRSLSKTAFENKQLSCLLERMYYLKNRFTGGEKSLLWEKSKQYISLEVFYQHLYTLYSPTKLLVELEEICSRHENNSLIDFYSWLLEQPKIIPVFYKVYKSRWHKKQESLLLNNYIFRSDWQKIETICIELYNRFCAQYKDDIRNNWSKFWSLLGAVKDRKHYSRVEWRENSFLRLISNSIKSVKLLERTWSSYKQSICRDSDCSSFFIRLACNYKSELLLVDYYNSFLIERETRRDCDGENWYNWYKAAMGLLDMGQPQYAIQTFTSEYLRTEREDSFKNTELMKLFLAISKNCHYFVQGQPVETFLDKKLIMIEYDEKYFRTQEEVLDMLVDRCVWSAWTREVLSSSKERALIEEQVKKGNHSKQLYWLTTVYEMTLDQIVDYIIQSPKYQQRKQVKVLSFQ